MKITDYELLHIRNQYDSNVKSYVKGNVDIKSTKEFLLQNQNQINGKINLQTSKLNNLKNPSETSKSNAITLATSKDIDIIRASMENELSRGNFPFVFYVSDLTQNSKSFSNVERLSLLKYREEAEKKSGYDRELNTLEQSKVVRAEIEATIENIDSLGSTELLSRVNTIRSSAEISYALLADKKGWTD